MSDVELVTHLFPDEVHHFVEDGKESAFSDGRKSGIEGVVLAMKEHGDDYEYISDVTDLSVDQIEEL